MKVVVGLGNPGRDYAHTRHNVGFDVVDRLARKMDAEFRLSSRFPVELAEGTLEGERVLLVKPQTFMNRSGEAVGPLVRKKGVSPTDIFVIVDDVDLPVGRLRLRKDGSAGGHNGLKSLIEHFGTDQFPRVRIGIGRQVGRDTVQHVLGRFSPDEAPVIAKTMQRAADAVGAALRDGMDRAMTAFNG